VESSRRLFAKGPSHASHYLIDHTDGLHDVSDRRLLLVRTSRGVFYLNTGESLAVMRPFSGKARFHQPRQDENGGMISEGGRSRSP